MAIERVDLHEFYTSKMVIFHSFLYVLPEGIQTLNQVLDFVPSAPPVEVRVVSRAIWKAVGRHLRAASLGQLMAFDYLVGGLNPSEKY